MSTAAVNSPLLLPAKITLMRRVAGTVPTVEQLLKHAERFGTECILETAADCGYGLETCMRVAEFCERIEVNQLPSYARKKRPDLEEKCKKLLGIVDEEETEESPSLV